VYLGWVLSEKGKRYKVAVKELSKKSIVLNESRLNERNEDAATAMSVSVLDRLRKEVTLQSTIRHPNVIQLLATHETVDTIFLVLEYAKRGDLLGLVRKQRISESIVTTMAWQVMSALEHCHENGIVHRDVKPENLLLDAEHNVKLTDFGLAAEWKEGQPGLSDTCGSITYAAPEIFLGKPYGKAVDVWSFGVMLYAVTTGKDPWGSDLVPFRTRMKKISSANYAPPMVSPECADLIRLCLNPDPEARVTWAEIKDHQWFRKHMPSWAQMLLFGEAPEDSVSEEHLSDIRSQKSSMSSGSANSEGDLVMGAIEYFHNNWPSTAVFSPSPLRNSSVTGDDGTRDDTAAPKAGHAQPVTPTGRGSRVRRRISAGSLPHFADSAALSASTPPELNPAAKHEPSTDPEASSDGGSSLIRASSPLPIPSRARQVLSTASGLSELSIPMVRESPADATTTAIALPNNNNSKDADVSGSPTPGFTLLTRNLGTSDLANKRSLSRGRLMTDPDRVDVPSDEERSKEDCAKREAAAAAGSEAAKEAAKSGAEGAKQDEDQAPLVSARKVKVLTTPRLGTAPPAMTSHVTTRSSSLEIVIGSRDEAASTTTTTSSSSQPPALSPSSSSNPAASVSAAARGPATVVSSTSSSSSVKETVPPDSVQSPRISSHVSVSAATAQALSAAAAALAGSPRPHSASASAATDKQAQPSLSKPSTGSPSTSSSNVRVPTITRPQRSTKRLDKAGSLLPTISSKSKDHKE
jgi:serine/threonine protein kinase